VDAQADAHEPSLFVAKSRSTDTITHCLILLSSFHNSVLIDLTKSQETRKKKGSIQDWLPHSYITSCHSLLMLTVFDTHVKQMGSPQMSNRAALHSQVSLAIELHRRPAHVKPDFNWLSGPQKWNLKAHMWYQLSPFPSSNVAICDAVFSSRVADNALRLSPYIRRSRLK